MKWIRELITANSMRSSKSFVLLLTAVTGCIGVLAISAGLVIEWARQGHITTDLSQLGIYLGGLATFVGAGSISKVSAERREKKVTTDTNNQNNSNSL